MQRFTLLMAVILLPGLAAISCARSPGGGAGQPITRPVPDAEGLARWLGEEPAGFFIQMADPQLGMSGSPLWLVLLGASWNDDHFADDARSFETAIAHANELAPAFVVICGDLINRVGHAGQIAAFQRIASQLDPAIPLYVVAGNHDVENAPTPESLRAYRETFGPDWYSFRHGEVYGIVLNSQLLDAPEHVPGEAQRQLAWLEEELARAGASGAAHVLVFQHHPYFLASPDEADQYFNIDRATRASYLALFERVGVSAVFAGHYHRNAYGRAGELEMVTTGPVGLALGDDPSGFRIVRFGTDGLRHEYFGLPGP